MGQALTLRGSNNDLLLICGDRPEENYPLYFRFVGPLVERALNHHNSEKIFVVVYEERVKNRRISGIFPLERGVTFMRAGVENLVKIISAGAPTPQKIKRELGEFQPGLQNLFKLVSMAYSSILVAGQPNVLPLSFGLDEASRLVDILSTDGTLAVVTDANDTVVYRPEAAKMKKEVVVESNTVVASSSSTYFYLEPDVAVVANIFASLFTDENYDGVHSLLLSGPSGYGKTAFCRVLAQKLGMDLCEFDMSLVVETEEVMGSRAIRDGSTTFQLNEFAQKVQKGNVVIIFDEMNRTHPGALNALFPFLDHRRGNSFQGQRIAVGPRVIFVGTRNIGTSYVGTQASDEALLRRFDFSVNVGFLPKEEEMKLLINRAGCNRGTASLIASAAAGVRELDLDVNCPPATTLLVADMATKGVKPRVAFQLNLVNKLADPQQRQAVESFLNRFIGETFSEAYNNSNIVRVF